MTMIMSPGSDFLFASDGSDGKIQKGTENMKPHQGSSHIWHCVSEQKCMGADGHLPLLFIKVP